MAPRRRAVLAGLALAALAGCADSPRASPRPEASGMVAPSDRPMPADGPFGFTHLRADGNRVLDGTGELPGAAPVDHDLGFEPAWIVGLPVGEVTRWAAVAPDGRTAGVDLADGAVEPVDLEPARLPAGVPPVLAAGVGGPALVSSPSDLGSTLTHPLPLGNGRALVVDAGGDVLYWDDGVVDRLAVDVLPDARIVEAVPGTYAVLGGATAAYDHGALGDEVEAGALVVFEVDDALSERARVAFPAPTVAEGLLPIGAPLDAAGEPALVVTLTDANDGARLAAYDTDGRQLAVGPTIGTGFRWRHQLAVAPFGPDGTVELAVVKTPHIGGVVEFYRRRGDELAIEATLSGYSSHAYGSRNLDGGLAADLDGDGAVELLVPTQARDALVGVRRTAVGAVAAWERPLGGSLATNVAGTTTASGRVVVAAGRADGTLRFWG